MAAFDHLADTYSLFDAKLAELEFQAAKRNWNRKEEEYSRRRVENDQAYFLYFFTRLEDHVNEQASKVIDRGVAFVNWKSRAPWRELRKLHRDDRLNFMSRVALLTETGGSDFNKVKTYYRNRNEIAHGGTATISMPTVIPDLKRLHESLKA